ncbi:GLPGLI family protein [Flavobacterium sp. TP390]|uniref:GLPGLI family protein n=1 Tax=Flavobacterium profundi TaxID=1774945 RepID=A0A6I4IKE9_9FLAO|nr:GLPGLI family protein [Flavobacterium profundi]MVO08759.1 GLPGLI family protein [Flavobacterium profundi]
MNRILFLVLFINFAFSQKIEVDFNFYINRENDLASTNKKFKLYQNDEFSVFKIIDIKDENQFKYKNEITNKVDKDSIIFYFVGNNTVETLFKEICYKDFLNDSQINNLQLGMNLELLNIKDSLFNLMKWEIIDSDVVNIANYNCKKAKTFFRGREYWAYYTNEIANQGGPWKFDGLPGFILKVESTDGFLLIEPTKIVFKKETQKISNPFLNKKVITFSQIKDKILEQDKKHVSKMKSRPNPPDKIAMSKPESIEDYEVGERVYE